MDIILYVVITLLFAASIAILILQRHEIKNIREAVFYTTLQNALLKEEVAIQKQNVENAKLANDDSFVKFLSDSRNWAFEYIEKVQEAISNFKNSVEVSAKYYEDTGYIAESVHKNSLETFVKAYRELEEFLPIEDETKEK